MENGISLDDQDKVLMDATKDLEVQCVCLEEEKFEGVGDLH